MTKSATRVAADEVSAPIASPVFTGNVGVGATSPSTSLHLKDNATAANTKLTVERSALSYTGEYAASHCGTVTNNEFDIHTNNTIRMRIDAAGHVIIGGGVTLGNGQTYAAANTLDDYEEGTWTPVVAASSGTITSYSSSGTYTKVGNLVTLMLRYTLIDVGSGINAASITGLPFAIATTNQLSLVGREDQLIGFIVSGGAASTTQVQINKADGSTTLANGRAFTVGITYQV